MTDELLPYYNSELAYIRELAAEFAEVHQGIAARLRMDRDLIEDPHVSRLIEAFAFLNARTRLKLDDEFPEISESLLQVLYPHYLCPIPSACIVRLKLDASQAENVSGDKLARGEMVETEPIENQPCRFRTCYPVQIWPVEVQHAEYLSPPFPVPPQGILGTPEAALQITLRCASPRTTFSQLEGFDQLRFFLHGQSQHTFAMYEALMNDALGVVWSSPKGGTTTRGSDSIQPVGFAADQGLLPYSARSFVGYRLLTEYFVFPEKFLFADLQLPDRQQHPEIFEQSELTFYVFLNRHLPILEQFTKTDMFQLGCTPVINLFEKRAEPIRMTQTQPEYRVVPDSRRPLAHEVYSIDRVVATSPDQQKLDFSPFYSLHHPTSTGERNSFWHGARRTAGYAGGNVDHGTELYLTLVDLQQQRSGLMDWTLDVMTTCLNRDLPRRLPFGGGQPYLQLSTSGSLSTVTCLTPPTETFRPALRRGTVWKLISHLSLNPLSLAPSEDGANALREIMRLYDFANSPTTRAEIEGIEHIAMRRAVGRAGGDVSGGFCRGIEVSLRIREEAFTGRSFYLLASVLERFFALYSSLNSFTKTVVHTDKREGAYRTWPPRAGERVLA